MPFPLFLTSDTVALTPDFVLQPAKRRLLDAALGIHHGISEQALPLLQLLQNDTSISELTLMAKRQHVSEKEMFEFLLFLNLCGAIQRKRSKEQIFGAWRLQMYGRIQGQSYQPMTHRFRVNTKNIVIAAIHASSSLVVATVVTDVMLWATRALHFIALFKFSCLSLIIFICSIVIHEYAHFAVISTYGHPAIIMQRGMRLGILHTNLSYGVEVLSAICGPLAGVIFCTGIAFMAQYAHFYALTIAAVLIAIIHGLGLLPWYGDGASLRKAYKHHAEFRNE